MTQTQHTPGPWYIGQMPTGEPNAWDGEPGYEQSIYSREGQVKIAVMEQWRGLDRAESEANARLIAAAPLMAEALAWALQAELALPDGIQHPELQTAIRQALQAAKGD